MFSQLSFLVVVIAAVNGCVKTGYKSHGESCQCSDACLGNSVCQRDGDGGFACLCNPCQTFDLELGHCIDLPGLDETCNDGWCAPGYTCRNNTDGSSTCQKCPFNQRYNYTLMECVDAGPLPRLDEPCTGACAPNLTCQEDANGNRTCQECPPLQVYDAETAECRDIPTPKPGEECTDLCPFNYTCQSNTDGKRTCQECQYPSTYDSKLLECVDNSPPGLGEPCTEEYECEPPYRCTNNTDGNSTCQACPTNQYFDYDTMACEPLPKYGESCKYACSCNLECQEDKAKMTKTCGCPAFSKGYNEATETCMFDCIRADFSTGCRCVANGDYPTCAPECEEGQYITCVNDTQYVRPCALGWYKQPDGTRFTAPLVFDPTLRRCEWTTPSCPRELDHRLEG